MDKRQSLLMSVEDTCMEGNTGMLAGASLLFSLAPALTPVAIIILIHALLDAS